jgi:hypothetical protein
VLVPNVRLGTYLEAHFLDSPAVSRRQSLYGSSERNGFAIKKVAVEMTVCDWRWIKMRNKPSTDKA